MAPNRDAALLTSDVAPDGSALMSTIDDGLTRWRSNESVV
jgi:hypothetical protein